MAKKIDFAAIGAKGGASRSEAKRAAAKENIVKAQAIGRTARTEAKAKAAKHNGKLGGRPAAVPGVVSKAALYKRAQRKRDKARLKNASK